MTTCMFYPDREDGPDKCCSVTVLQDRSLVDVNQSVRGACSAQRVKNL